MRRFLLVTLCILTTSAAYAARASEVTTLHTPSILESILRCLSFADEAVRHAFIGAVLMGIGCGLMGSFLVVRRMALVGDTLSHAVLPGIVLGFLWAGGRDPWAIFVGALLAGFAGIGVMHALRTHLKVREDSALGLVLSGFFSLGIVLLTMLERAHISGKGGLDRFLFGQAAALGPQDLQMMAWVIVPAAVCITFLYKLFLALSFDKSFAKSIRLPIAAAECIFMVLLTAVVVVSLKAGGVVLVSALLITPAATAQLLTQRLPVLIGCAISLSVLSTCLGALMSSVVPGLPTGPCMVLVAGIIFSLALLFAPHQGLIFRWFSKREAQRRIALENALKALFHCVESAGFNSREVALADFVQKDGIAASSAMALCNRLVDEGLALWVTHAESNSHQARTRVLVTEAGWLKACQVVRGHRLWELYLAQAVDYALDHVHEDAERVEHFLNPTMIQALEERLNYPASDPHGKIIPSGKTQLPGHSIEP